MKIAFRAISGLLIGGLLATSLFCGFVEPSKFVELYPGPHAVTNLDDALDATVGMICRDNVTHKALLGGTGARLYSPQDGKWMIVTAGHVTANCKKNETFMFTFGPDGVGLKSVVTHGTLYAVYKRHEYKVKTIEEDQFKDVSIVMTTKKIFGGYSYFEGSEKSPSYLQPVKAIGFTGNFNFPVWAHIVTMGHIAHPLVSFEAQLEENGPKELVLYIVADELSWHGNSGGVLVDDQYKILGITVAGDEARLSYSSPFSYVKELLKKHKYYENLYNL